jgi:hypothetical protein
MERNLQYSSFVALLVFTGGCSGPTFYPVAGVVRLNGRPLSRASVMLIPNGSGQPAAGSTDAAGRFVLETGNAVGVAPGEYSVVVVCDGLPELANDRTSLQLAPVSEIIPQRYGKPEQSGLKFKIPSPGPEAYDLELTSP